MDAGSSSASWSGPGLAHTALCGARNTHMVKPYLDVPKSASHAMMALPKGSVLLKLTHPVHLRGGSKELFCLQKVAQGG
jgi:hypothetical protein